MKGYYLVFLLLAGPALCNIFGDENYIYDYVDLGESRHHGQLYYILFKSRDENPNAPLIWYLEGGPGQSSMHGLFYQNGPFRLKKDQTLEKNQYSFNNIADVLYLDQPLGTGFSNCTNTSWVPHNENVIINDLITFVQAFYEKHTEYNGRPLYLTSQGYGSHFILPLATILAQRIIKPPNIQGIALGSAWIRPEIQLVSIPGFSKSVMAVTEIKYIASLYGFIIASIFIDLDLDVPAYDLIELAMGVVAGVFHHQYNRLDYRIRCSSGPCNYNFSDLNHFLDKQEVREAMGTIGRSFNYSSYEVFRWLVSNNEYLSDKSPSLIDLLCNETLPIYIYGGMYDWTINTVGLDDTVASLHWPGRAVMNNLTWKAWYTDGKLHGRYKHHKHLYYAHATNAGHYVGMDVPEFTLDLMTRLIYGSDH